MFAVAAWGEIYVCIRVPKKTFQFHWHDISQCPIRPIQLFVVTALF